MPDRFPAVAGWQHARRSNLNDVVSGAPFEENLVNDGGFALGVLWHPEEDARSQVIGALAGAAREGRVAAL